MIRQEHRRLARLFGLLLTRSRRALLVPLLSPRAAPRRRFAVTARRARSFRPRSARQDEVPHARVMAAYARTLGARVPSALVVPPAIKKTKRVRSLEAIAIENAVEGTVKIGALVATVQARASVPELRSTFARIAADETRHAALACAAARWMEGKLSAMSRARVANARRAAIDALVAKRAVGELSRRFFGGTRALAAALA